MSFKDFKKRMKEQGIDDVSKELEEVAGKGPKDERFWYPKLDDKKNSFSIIRFLPAPYPEKSPAVKTISYYIEGPGGIYRENSPDAIGLPDPVKQYSKKLWASGDEDEAKKLFPRTYYISNILVVKDPGNPENEGKVFLFKYGKKIFNMIQEKVKPQFQQEERINVFNFWKGANFKLKTCDQGGYVNYDKSEFASQSVLFDGDEELIEEVYNSLYQLQPFIDESNFKPFEELKANFYKVMGFELDEEDDVPAPKSSKKVKPSDDEDDLPAPKSKSKPAKKEEDEDEDDLPESWGVNKKSAKAESTEDEDDVEDEDEEEDDVPAPKSTKANGNGKAVKKAKPPVEDEDEEESEDEDEDEEEDTPPAKSAKSSKTSKPAPTKKDKAVEDDDDLSFFDD